MNITDNTPRINYSDLQIGDSFFYENSPECPFLLIDKNTLFDWDTHEISLSPYRPKDKVIRIKVKVMCDLY